jgi:hypothetical protein
MSYNKGERLRLGKPSWGPYVAKPEHTSAILGPRVRSDGAAVGYGEYVGTRHGTIGSSDWLGHCSCFVPQVAVGTRREPFRYFGWARTAIK